MAEENIFHFKQFGIRHDRCAMKVGTDGVLLGAWASVDDARSALDVGTGTGLIALMLAQRNSRLRVVGVEIDEEAAQQAKENAAASPWPGRIKMVQADFRNIETGDAHFDLIVSNPPFFTEQTGCPDTARHVARHVSALPTAVLMEKAGQMLNEEGRLSLIVPSSAATEVIGEAALQCLFLTRRTDVKTTPRKAAKRTLLEFSRKPVPCEATTLTLRDADNQMNPEYRELTEGFYL